MQHKHLFKKYCIPSFLFLIGLAVGFYLLFFLNNTFRIKKIEIVGATQEERKTLVKLLTGESTLITQPADLKKTIAMRYPTMEIKECRIQLPDTLIVTLKKNTPVAYVQTDYGYIALSQNGTVLKKERSSTVPQPSIFFYQLIHHSEYQTGQSIGFSSIVRALTFIIALEDEGYATETVAIDSVDMIACKTKGFEVAFSQSRPIELQLHEVSKIVRQIKAGALRIVRLDLRFDKPVVQLPDK